MATDTAVASTMTSRSDPTRNVWQVPILLLGIAAFVCTWKGCLPSLSSSDPTPSFTSSVMSLKSAYEKVLPDPNELKNLLSKVAGSVDAYPDQASFARFQLGSGYVRLAEITPAPDEAYGYWMLALQHFELVNDKQLRDPADPAKLVFRTAKARVATRLPDNTPPAEIVQLMNILSRPQIGEEAGETQRLVAELALKLNPPDINRAKIALTLYLTSTGIATPSASLARARLLLGNLHFQTHDGEQARKWLKEIGNDAPADVLAPAKTLLAQVLMAQNNWADAAKELELLRGAPGVSRRDRHGAVYQLAVCKLMLRDQESAARLFEEAASGEGSEARAAALQLAELRLKNSDKLQHLAAVDLLTSAIKDIREPAAYDASFVRLNDAQAIFEFAVTTLVADGAHESALRVAEKYELIASPGRDREKRAEVYGSWAESLQKAKSGEAKAMLKKAADEYAALVGFQPTSIGKLEMLRRSAALSRQAEDNETAAKRLEDALKLPDISEQTLPAVWVELADALLAANRPDQVFKIFNKIMASNAAPHSTATRYRLARVFVDSRHPGLVQSGRALFEQIAKQENVLPAEREYHERSLTELANALIREGNFADAESRLRTQLGIYQNGPEAPLAKLLLGVCLLQRAAAPNVQASDATKMRTEALSNFKEIVANCDTAERRNGKLSDRETWLRLQAGLRVLQTHQKMNKPAELLADAAPLLDRHKNTVEELIILSLVFHAFKQMNDAGKALDTRARMKETFERLPQSAFTQPNGEYSRDYWQKVWFAPEPK